MKMRHLLWLASAVASVQAGCQVTPDANGHVDMGAATSIGSDAFRDCTALVSVSMPNVTSIGYYAFFGCTSLALTSLPPGVTTIGTSAFEGCTSLRSVTIPSSVTEIGLKAFCGCRLPELTRDAIRAINSEAV